MRRGRIAINILFVYFLILVNRGERHKSIEMMYLKNFVYGLIIRFHFLLRLALYGDKMNDSFDNLDAEWCN